MNRPDFPKYPVIENLAGPPFVPYGKKNLRVNVRYLAELYIHEAQVRMYDGGWVRWDGEWKSLNETEILNDLEELVSRLCTDSDNDGKIQVSESELRETLQIVKRKAYSGSMPQMNPDIIPVSNGVLRWVEATQDFDFVDYTPEIMVFDRMPIKYDPTATAPQFKAVLQEIIPDTEDRRVAQEYLGAALFSVNLTRKFLLCYGEGGCGKSVLILFLTKILGSSRVFDLNIESVKHDYALAGLKTQTLLTASEAASRVLCTDGAEWVKKAVGGDFFQTQMKFRNEKSDHHGTFSLVIVSNNRLRFQYEGRGDEWRDRVIPIFFDQHIPEERRELGLVDRLLREEGPGIFNWFLEGARRVRRNKWRITLSPVQRDRVERLLALSNPMKVFVQNHIKPCAGKNILSSEALAKFIDVREEAGLPNLSPEAFYKLLATAMAEVYRVAGVNSLPGKQRGYRGFELV